MLGEEKEPEETNLLLFFRFYIESISFLKDRTTVELFFLNAKSCVHKVRPASLVSSRQMQARGVAASAFLSKWKKAIVSPWFFQPRPYPKWQHF